MIGEHVSTFNQPSIAWLDHALPYARRGWSIIPVIAKRAVGLWKPFQSDPADERTLRQLFAKPPGITGLAVILGQVSGGLACRDFDVADSYHAWAAANAEDAAALPTVRTARGFHVYGRLDEETFADLGDGELRADAKHYVLLPPSRHPSGITYEWMIPLPDGPLPMLPVSLAQPGPGQQPKATQGNPETQEPTTQTHNPLAPYLCPRELPDVQQAVTDTIPSGQCQRRRRLFDLARALKGVVPEANPADLRAIVQDWHRRALPFIGTKDFWASWTDFVAAWGCVKTPSGQSFRAAAHAAEAGGLPDLCLRQGYEGDLRRLAALCWQLQLQWGERPFPLGCRKAAEFLGNGKSEANRMLGVLRFDGVIRLVKKGTKGSGKASEWNFVAAM